MMNRWAWGQATPSMQMAAGMVKGRKKKRASSKRKKASAKKKRVAAKSVAKRAGKRLVKGSAAAKAYMAKIRKKRKK